MPAATMLPSLQASHPTDTVETSTIDRAFGKPSNNNNSSSSSSIDGVHRVGSSSGVTSSSSSAAAWIQASISKEDNSVNTESLTASTETSAGTRSNNTTNNVMEGIKEVASGTLENIKEWAVSPKQNRCNPIRREEDDCVLSDEDDDNENPPQSTVSKQQQQQSHQQHRSSSPSKKNPTAMEDSGVTTLSSSPSYQQQQQQSQQQQSHHHYHQAQSVPPQAPLSPTRRARPAGIETTRRPKNPQDPTRSLIRDLISPFIACGLVDPQSSAHNGCSNANGNSSTLSPTRRYKNRAASAPNGALLDAFIERQTNVDDSSTVFSYDSATEEEILQLRRLTSWATINTMETDDASYMAGSITSESSFATNGTNPIQAVDDDGHVIPQILLEQAQRRRRQQQQQQQQMRKRRTKLVRFEYPPISRLRECPRHDPQDLPDLFFTEEELDEIEADRHSTLTADDVEIVAVQTSEEDMETLDRFTAYQSTPKLRNHGNSSSLARRPASPYPRGMPTSPAGSDVQPGLSGDQSEAASSAANSNGSTRLIKGVQIYLRERSTGRSVASNNNNNNR